MKYVQYNHLQSIVLVCGLMLHPVFSFAQGKDVYTVAIFLYQNVELLDFAGPTEVFAATKGFKVYTVSADGKEVLSQGLLKVSPEYAIYNAPEPDIIVFPGGNSGPSSRDEKVIAWVKEYASSGSTIMSVCTGAFILARAGLLDSLEITTHYGSLKSLQELLPQSTVLEQTRFVDNGSIITTAGVSAGIDGALHLVARIKGLEVAKATARYMEYDKWNPQDGKVAAVHPCLEYYSGLAGNEKEKEKDWQPKIKNEVEMTIPFEGELVAHIDEMHRNSLYALSASLIEKGVKWYPQSVALYDQLGLVYAKEGELVPLNSRSFMKLIEQGLTGDAKMVFERTADEYPGWMLFYENEMNDKAYAFLNQQKYEDAITLFQLNTLAYPKSGNVWDSLGEAYMNAGDKQQAILNYKKSIKLDPGNINAVHMLEQLEGKNQ